MAENDREKQIAQDRYYMGIAEAVELGASCLGSKIGAVLVLNNRVIGTGYNGTPSGFPNCDEKEKGCVRCYDRWLEKQGRVAEMSDPTHTAGQALDRCICVHAEQNAFITAARYGIHVEDAFLYTTLNPCFNCLKEAIQAGVKRIVYKNWYPSKYSTPLKKQYAELVHHLTEGDKTLFEVVGGGQVAELVGDAPPDPFEDDKESDGLKPEEL
jgi:dCMP deaminase